MRDSRIVLPLVVLLVGCDTPAEPSPDGFVPHAFFVDGTFGWDATTERARAWWSGEDHTDPTVAITVYDARFFDTGDPTWACSVVLSWDTLRGGEIGPADWMASVDPPPFTAFDLPPGASRPTDCAGWPRSWGPDPARVVAAWTWGLGIGALASDVRAELRAAVESDTPGAWEAAWAPVVFGAGVRWSGAEDITPAGYLDHGYGYAIAVDDDFTVRVDDEGAGVPIPATDVTDGPPPTGAYFVRGWFGVDAALLR